MPTIEFTPEQRRAVETVGRSVIVSAAAGSGKTAVLAARCAHLVCDAVPPHRCDADELLVLTFTDAAAAEVRARVVDAIRERAERRPENERLRRQVTLVESAQISTIHSFCLWLVRRWFSRAGLDPAATVLDQHEARLIRKEVIDGLFTRLYEQAKPSDEHVLGHVVVDDAPAARDAEGVADGNGRNGEPDLERDSLAHGFVRMVDAYGLGDDRSIDEFVLGLDAFVSSLPDPDGWLRDAADAPAREPESVVERLLEGLRRELSAQREHCKAMAARFLASDTAKHFHAERIREYAEQLHTWLQAAPATNATGTSDVSGAEAMACLKQWAPLLAEIRAFEFPKSRAPALSRDSDNATKTARKEASKAYSDVKARLFGKRLRDTYAGRSIDQWLDGLSRVAPYVQTLVDLARAFGESYSNRKRELNVLDFADLERFAFALLHDPNDLTSPSEVGRVLHRRFAHVLVDEFQDVNPLQQAILRLASRESDTERDGNLFVVGDVRQSIYRFRLAEPRLFTERLERFRRGADGVAISLQENFRSRPEVLEAVNLLFRGLMRRDLGDIAYDREAELRVGRKFSDAGSRHPVELHLLERAVFSRDGQDDGAESDGDQALERSDEARSERGDLTARAADLNDPSKWDSIEREAHFIGLKIRGWVDGAEPVVDGNPVRYRDIAVLLRVTTFNAERVAAMLNSMGIPAFAAVGGAFFGTLEVRDVLAALELLDNTQQDVPLAAVVRSGIFGHRFTEDELVDIRCHRRGTNFHEAVREYANGGSDADVRSRLQSFAARVDRFRDSVRRRPLADVLWALYEEHGYLAYACGLPNGVQRRANLLKLHELARTFGTFRRQGLHRFLRFVQSLDEDGRDLAVAPAIGESEDVVRVMSIHQAKGLEFPVVYLAGLGTQFNLGDRSGRMIFERESKIGLRVVDSRRMIEYPSACHRRVAAEVERSTRAEELRVLYVAMTRARDRLVLVGSERGVSRRIGQAGAYAGGSGPTLLELTTARTPLDWIVPVLAAAGGASLGAVGANGGRERTADAVFTVRIHEAAEIAQWRVDSRDAGAHFSWRRAVARGDNLPGDEPNAPDDPEVERVLERMEFVYPNLAVASVPVTMAAGAFKGAFDYLQPERDWHDASSPRDAFVVPPSRYGATAAEDAVRRGLLMHRVLQHLDFAAVRDDATVEGELDRLVAGEVLSEAERVSVDKGAIGWLVRTPLADEIRAAGKDFRRELQFIAAEPPGSFDRQVTAAADDFILVRGVVDAVWPGTDGMEIVDFKTDGVAADDVPARMDRYRSQMTLYARAIGRLFRRRVARCRLVFLTPCVVAEVAPG